MGLILWNGWPNDVKFEVRTSCSTRPQNTAHEGCTTLCMANNNLPSRWLNENVRHRRESYAIERGSYFQTFCACIAVLLPRCSGWSLGRYDQQTLALVLSADEVECLTMMPEREMMKTNFDQRGISSSFLLGFDYLELLNWGKRVRRRHDRWWNHYLLCFCNGLWYCLYCHTWHTRSPKWQKMTPIPHRWPEHTRTLNLLYLTVKIR